MKIEKGERKARSGEDQTAQKKAIGRTEDNTVSALTSFLFLKVSTHKTNIYCRSAIFDSQICLDPFLKYIKTRIIKEIEIHEINGCVEEDSIETKTLEICGSLRMQNNNDRDLKKRQLCIRTLSVDSVWLVRK